MKQTRRDLPEEIITNEILIRLSVKVLCRFKSVSKFWNLRISSYQFARAHLNYSQNQLNCETKWVFFQHGENSCLFNYEAYDHEDAIVKHKMLRVTGTYNDPGGLISIREVLGVGLNGVTVNPVGSSRGLVCLLCERGRILVSNPIIRQSQMILAPHSVETHDIILSGFGYVSSMDDFKIVLGMRERLEGKKEMIYVCSLRNNDWRMIKGVDQFHVMAILSIENCRGTLVNERLHWWRAPTGSSDDGRIFSLDLLHERLEEIRIPEPLKSKMPYMYCMSDNSGLSVMGGCLCLSILWEEQNAEIWMLKEYTKMDSWTKLYQLQLAYYANIYTECFGFTKTGKFLIRCWNNSHSADYLVLVDPDQCYPKFNLVANFSAGTSTIVNYVESLVSPFGRQHRTTKGVEDRNVYM